MGNRKKKLSLKDVDEELAEVDNIYMVSSNPTIGECPIGSRVFVNMPMFARRLKLYRMEQFNNGIISKEQYDDGCIIINDKTLLYPDKTYDIELTPEVKELLRCGILRGGGRTRIAKYRKPMKTFSIQEIEEEERKKNK